MKNLKELIAKKDILIDNIAAIRNALNPTAIGNDARLSVGNRCSRVFFSSDDKDLRDVLELKKSKFEAELLPITERLKILDELASETLKNQQG